MLDDDDTPSRAPAPLAVGWDDEDVAMLREMAQLTMDQARSLAADARAHAAALEAGEAEPMSAAERSQLSLAMARAARCLRLTLALKAVAKGAKGPAPSRTVLGEGADDGVWRPTAEEIAQERAQCAAEMRFGLDYAITDPAHDAAEVERLREGLETAIERELERDHPNYELDNNRLFDIAWSLGLRGEFRSASYADGRCAGPWILGRPGESGDPLIWPDPPPKWGDFLQRWKKPAPGALAPMTCYAKGEVDPDEWPP